jgi:glycosyltransferase involved in cell wall biosynthesis
VEDPSLPSFALVVATVDRADAVRTLLDSLERQTYSRFQVVIVDQNDDDRLLPALGAHDRLDIVRIRSARGLSRARNAALPTLRADIVAFPDDDCAYPDDLLERVARLLATRVDLDGVTGRTADAAGQTSGRWADQPTPLQRNTIWHGGNSASTFLRRELVERVGAFDEQLGLGSGTAWGSGEEIDYLVRALDLGARIEFDPAVVVVHEFRTFTAGELRAVGRRDGGSVGYILRKHRYPARVVTRMLVRPLGGVAASLVRGDVARARFHAAALRGRLAGLRS